MRTAPALLLVFALSACSGEAASPDAGQPDASSPDASSPDAAGLDDAGPQPPLELTPDLCDDAGNLAALTASLSGGSPPTYGTPNVEQFMRMFAAPTEGPFYMVNLIRFHERAMYADGRDTELTGREANDLYSPLEFLAAVGASVVFAGDVEATTLGEEGTWDQIAIVEYPCPIALFAMSAHPEFQARSVHKDAGVEASLVIVTHLAPADVSPVDSPYPATPDDPAFESVQLLRYHDEAQYAPTSTEPPGTGAEAMARYAAAVRDAERRVGVRPTARLVVQGVLIGDGRTWDEVWLDFVPSGAARDALAADTDFVAAQPHREAAIAEGYAHEVAPLISSFPAP